MRSQPALHCSKCRLLFSKKTTQDTKATWIEPTFQPCSGESQSSMEVYKRSLGTPCFPEENSHFLPPPPRKPLSFRQMEKVLNRPAPNWMMRSCFVSCLNGLGVVLFTKGRKAQGVDSYSPDKENTRVGRAGGKDLAAWEYIRSWRGRGRGGRSCTCKHVFLLPSSLAWAD